MAASKYKGVSKTTQQGRPLWRMSIQPPTGKRINTIYPFTPEGERQAARNYDLLLIKFGKQPVNILKPKKDDVSKL